MKIRFKQVHNSLIEALEYLGEMGYKNIAINPFHKREIEALKTKKDYSIIPSRETPIGCATVSHNERDGDGWEICPLSPNSSQVDIERPEMGDAQDYEEEMI